MASMGNITVQCEAFENAVRVLRDALNAFNTDSFGESCRTFERSIDKLARIAGMQSENDQRKHLGDAMAYTENDFNII